MTRYSFSDIVGRIGDTAGAEELLLDGPQADEPRQEIRTACLVVGAACSSTTKRLLSHNRTCAFAVDVEISGRVSQSFFCVSNSCPVCSEYRSCETIFTGLVDGLADVFESC